ncbi:hypothetical protein L3Q82_004757 [Scortum barcoo]|uniref:Uncharacterized protein n=1 Tax=Scortum barcoo TaxID=214431 RepID=A0ACB8VHL5_9TELE|nr:hypothetical protein L3Q82_004757 [Scortum barcoo]
MGVLADRAQDPNGHRSRFQLQATVCYQLQNLLLQALVDSGAEENFLDRQVAAQAGVPFEPLEKPRDALAVDGRIMARVTHRTQPLTLVISGNHTEEIQFLLISAPNTPLILGFPWLATHNPHLDWARGENFWTGASGVMRPAYGPPSHPQQNQPVPVAAPRRWIYLASRRSIMTSRSRLYHLSRPESEAMEKYIRESLAAGLIRPSKAPLGAGFFFVEKKDSSLCPCIDYRGLNNITIRNKYPLPLIDSAFTPLQGAVIFTKLDLRNTYHLVRIREGDEWKTAFNTPLGHFEYLVMPFGLTNAPAVFQALINDVLRDFLNHFVFVYLDDILIFSRSLKEHQSHVHQVLQRLLENRLYVKKEKCEFHTSRVSFLGFIVERGQVQADPEKVDASDVGVGAVLSQRQGPDAHLHPCAFFSRCLTPAEANSTTWGTGNSSYAVKLALEEWRHRLEGAAEPFVVWTDHKNLAYIQSAKRLNPRQARWALFFSRFNFSLTYRPGSLNTKPDALSRLSTVEDAPRSAENILPASHIIASLTWGIEETVHHAQEQQPDPGGGSAEPFVCSGCRPR